MSYIYIYIIACISSTIFFTSAVTLGQQLCDFVVLLQGAVTGLFTGLAVSLWIGFGGPKPIPKQLPMSTDSCPQADLLDRNTSSVLQMSGLIETVTAAGTRIGEGRWDRCTVRRICW
jgi:hypothetical protein